MTWRGTLPSAWDPVLRSRDRTSAWRIAVDAAHKAHAHRAAIGSAFRDILGLGRLVKAWAAGEYTRVPWRTIALATGALLYFLNPLDLIPDALLVVGYLDDATVVTMVASSIRGDIERFRQWEAGGRGNLPEPRPA
jgi:uncharacterized membrane protein YkvA (DUF1232 family)